MAHPHHAEAKKGHAKKLESYGGKSKKSDNWAGDEDLNTSGKPAGLMPILKEPKLSQDTNPEIMRKAGGKVAPKRLDKAPRKAKAHGGKLSAEKFEGSAKDEAQDKKLAKKHGMSFKKWEESSLDEKHDRQQSMKGLKKGGGVDKAWDKYKADAKKAGISEETAEASKSKFKPSKDRAERRAGGRIGKEVGGPMGMNKRTPTTINIQVPGAGQPPMMAGQPLSGAPTAPAGPGPQLPPGVAGGLPPVGMGGIMPPMGAGAPPIMPQGAPGVMPPAAPMPPTGLPPMGVQRPPMGRKKGGRITSTEDLTAGAGSGEGRLQKTELAENDRKKG